MRGFITIVTAVLLLVAAAPARPAAPRRAGHSERLAARARRGDRQARTMLVEGHMSLVRSLAFRYRGLGVPVDDLVQEGAIGLLTAVDRYDPALGATLSTYAFWRVRAAVTHAVTTQRNAVRVPRPLLERRREVATARRQLARDRGPTIDELASATELARAEVVEALAPIAVVSLDDGEHHAVAEALIADAAGEPDAQLARREEMRSLRRAFLRLTPRKREIVGRHFGLAGRAATLNEIGADLHLSPERTRALKDDALRELAAALAASTP